MTQRLDYQPRHFSLTKTNINHSKQLSSIAQNVEYKRYRKSAARFLYRFLRSLTAGLIQKNCSNSSQKSCNIPHYIVYLHPTSSEKCRAWHKSEVISAHMRIERDIIK